MITVTSPDVFDALRSEMVDIDARIREVVDIGIPQVNELVRGVVAASGKRLRPAVLLLTGKAFAPDHDALISAAAGIELLHTASLVHDDDIDHAALRRGKPTLSTQVSSVTAILIGDYLFAQSAILAAATNSTRVVSVFASTLGDLCQGQIREMLESHRIDQSVEQYEERIYGKTASLFASAAEMGAIIGQAPEATISAARAYGRDLGMAFQIIDDVLDLREASGTIGKPAGNDLREGTITLPVLRYLAEFEAGSTETTRIIDIAAGDITDPDAIDAVVQEIRVSGALDQATASARDYIAAAKRSLDTLPIGQSRRYLAEIADFVLSRST